MSTDQGNIPAVHTLEGLPVSCYRKWLRGRWEDQAKKAPARRALDVYEAVADRDMLTESEIAPILDAARSTYFVAWDIGMQLLCKLGGRHRVAHEAMRNLMEAGKATLRGRVLGALHDRLRLDPCIPSRWPGFEVEWRRGKTQYSIAGKNPRGVERGVTSVTVDGKPAQDGWIALADDGRRHAVVVVLG